MGSFAKERLLRDKKGAAVVKETKEKKAKKEKKEKKAKKQKV